MQRPKWRKVAAGFCIAIRCLGQPGQWEAEARLEVLDAGASVDARWITGRVIIAAGGKRKWVLR
jgi:hypothetical protein